MNAGTRFFIALFAFAACWLAATQFSVAQPKGWPCDLAIRPGNAWYYRSTIPGYEFYRDSVDRDSIGTDGSYWVHFRPGIGTPYWYRFDTSCAAYRYTNPAFSFDELWLKPLADTGESWIVSDTSNSGRYTTAQVYAIFPQSIFGRIVQTQEVVYYDGEVGERWFLGVEYAAGIGEVRSRDHLNTTEIIGAVIDGVPYGNVSTVEAAVAGADIERMAIAPLPAAETPTLRFTAPNARTATLTVYDMLGRPVHRRELNELSGGANAVPLDVRDLPNGAYLVTLAFDGRRLTAPLVVAR